MSYEFLIDTYATERLKVVSVWSMFRDGDLRIRPREDDPRGRNPLEHMVHQCESEDLWFRTILGIDVGAPPLPGEESRLGFIRRYAEDSRRRLDELRDQADEWWRETVTFFGVPRTRDWVVVRRIAHTAHHRGQQTALLRMLGRDVYSTYGPTADTGSLPTTNQATVYPYPDLVSLVQGEEEGGDKQSLPGAGSDPVTERPG